MASERSGSDPQMGIPGKKMKNNERPYMGGTLSATGKCCRIASNRADWVKVFSVTEVGGSDRVEAMQLGVTPK